jgi:D-erythrose 4-phosphate dehydrogenase
MRLAINGYGRIGRSVLRAYFERGGSQSFDLVAINELADTRTIAHLTRYDSTHGRFAYDVDLDGDNLLIQGRSIALSHEPDAALCPWAKHEIDMVLECTGAVGDRATAQWHLDAGSQRLLFSQPAAADIDATIVYGVNQELLQSAHQVASTGSCTTNAIVPVIDALDKAFGIAYGTITTIHSAMNDQPVLDAYHHTDLRKTRAASQSIIPVDTALAKGIERILPHLADRFSAQALRVPTVNVSAMDLSVYLKRSTSVASVNDVLRHSAEDDYLGVLGFTTEPLASCDFNHDCRSGVVDASQTRVSGDRLVKVLIWFDNEWGYANRMLDVAEHWAKISGKGEV